MSYLRKFEYEILPEETYTVLRHCPVCSNKSAYGNSSKFRVNANGNQLDVWLIYRCKKCKHTYNLTIHERLGKEDFPPGHYRRFMDNDPGLAMECGMDMNILSKNKAEINKSGIPYQLLPVRNQEPASLLFTRQLELNKPMV